MSRGGGGRRRGGRGDFQREPDPTPGGAAYRGRGGGGRGEAYAHQREEYPPLPTRGKLSVGEPPVAPADAAVAGSRAPASAPRGAAYLASPPPNRCGGGGGGLGRGGGRGEADAHQPDEYPRLPTRSADLPPSSSSASKELRPPARPGYGNDGCKCIVRANHFLVEASKKFITHCNVSITPEVTSRAIKRAIIRELVHSNTHGKINPAYDGDRSLYIVGGVPSQTNTFTITLPDSSKRAEKKYEVILKEVAMLDLHHLESFLEGRQMDNPQETIKALNVVLRETPSQKYTMLSRYFLSPEFGIVPGVGGGMECWRGYYQSLRPTQMGLSLNIDMSAKCFLKDIPVVDFIAEYLNLNLGDSRPLSDGDYLKATKVLIGIRVVATHWKGSPRRYKIRGLTNSPLNQMKFEDVDTEKIVSVVDFFKEKYNYTLKHVHLPCVLAGTNDRPVYLPMEVCKILKGQPNEKTPIARQHPLERETSIRGIVELNKYSNDVFAKEFGIRITNQLTLVDARVLPSPMLKFHDMGEEKFCTPVNGEWDMKNKKTVNGGAVEYWTYLDFSSLRVNEVDIFFQKLVKMCEDVGMSFNYDPLIPAQKVNNPDSIDAALREVHTRCAREFARRGIKDKHLQLLFIVLPKTKESYGKIKLICETQLGIVSQCFLSERVRYCKTGYLVHVSLKINVKVGGRNTVLNDAFHNIPFAKNTSTIIFGADVTHPVSRENSQSSIAAVVASMDWPEVAKYRGLVSAQKCGQEIITDLYTLTKHSKGFLKHGGMIRELLHAFYQRTNRKPDRIIFYRDGVGEGQFNTVLQNEVTAIRTACLSFDPEYKPPITFVVVQKRHNTRLFLADVTQESKNIFPGTVVDTKICHPREFDFYLCSHNTSPQMGTSRPTHYHVLCDENKFSADALQTLTNNLCYTYARCTRAVSIVPPVHYAHLAASRARYYTNGGQVESLPEIKDNVKEVMFYC